ncbi:TPA: PTS sugar transporter subunit IIA, partial [Enterococcus faecium]
INDLMMKTEEKEVIVITDIFGGSVNNEFLRYIEQSNFYLISGLNLSFLIELITQMGSSEETVAIIKQSLKDSIRSIQFCNESVRRNIIEEDF